MFQAIEFISQQVMLRGRLYLPKTASSKKHPVVIMSHGFTTTIHGMTADKYAERFRKADFAVLLFDHRNLGSSDGEPSKEINFWVESKGYIDAIDFAIKQRKTDTNKIIVWGGEHECT